MLKQILLCGLLCSASLLPLPVAAQTSFYGHDRGWKHGHVVNGSTLPDDYLMQAQPPSGEITRSTPPFGYYARKSDGQMLTQNNGAVRSINVNRRPSTLVTAPNDLYANGMGGVAFDGNDYGSLNLNDDAYMTSVDPYSANCNYAAPQQRPMRRVYSQRKPRVIYYSGQPALRWGNAMNHQPLLPGTIH